MLPVLQLHLNRQENVFKEVSRGYDVLIQSLVGVEGSETVEVTTCILRPLMQRRQQVQLKIVFKESESLHKIMKALGYALIEVGGMNQRSIEDKQGTIEVRYGREIV